MTSDWFDVVMTRGDGPSGRVCVLGETLSHSDEVDAVGRLLLWFSYRSGFEPLAGTSLTSDAHFGCLARTAQMIVANSLARAFLPGDGGPLPGQRWLPVPAELERAICQLFVDLPERPFSIHQICGEGERLGLRPGCWFGPSIVSHAFERLSAAASGRLDAADDRHLTASSPLLGCFRVLVMANATIDEPAVLGLIDQGCAVLLLVQTKLGIDHAVNPVYVPELANFFALPACMGIIGGRPGASYYFIGCAGTDCLYYLDPHVVQKCLDPADEPLDTATFHSPRVHAMPFRSLDPSLAFGVFCSSRADLDSLRHYAATATTPLFSFAVPARSQSPSGSLSLIDDDVDAVFSAALGEHTPPQETVSSLLAAHDPSLIMVSNADGHIRIESQHAQSEDDDFVVL